VKTTITTTTTTTTSNRRIRSPCLAKYIKKFGFLNIDILNNGKTLRATFFRNDGLARDQFTIRKDESPTTPSLILDGNDRYDVPSRSNLQLSKFSVTARFNTNKDYTGDPFIVNKGGTGSETLGKNMNYGIWMTSSEKIRAGFETSSGMDYFATNLASYRDDKCHYAVATYGGSTVRYVVLS
jgi:hypothetical protein